MIITKTCRTCEHFPNDKHCIGCEWDKSKVENTKWELKKNPIVIERAVLDKIRNEIEQERDKVYQNRQGHDTYYADGLDTALEIIDKYKGDKE